MRGGQSPGEAFAASVREGEASNTCKGRSSKEGGDEGFCKGEAPPPPGAGAGKKEGPAEEKRTAGREKQAPAEAKVAGRKTKTSDKKLAPDEVPRMWSAAAQRRGTNSTSPEPAATPGRDDCAVTEDIMAAVDDIVATIAEGTAAEENS
ncbi:hypothetical protein PI124_g4274 [Phytophthora idaei]|nr:hypothetical protein PI125_g3406 [Phytophthora idaei]KAG3251120.1 hypothetical protein PI124_g4274 [Phytophthora idaei]